jgi:integrase
LQPRDPLMPTQKLSDKMLRGLKPPAEGQIDIWDEVLPSFGVRIGKSGRKTFFVGTRIRGKYRRITIQPAFPQLELAEARSRAREIIADAQGGVGPELRKKRDEAGTFGAVAAAFMQDFAQHHRTRGEMQRYINGDLAVWHNRQIAEITRAEIKELLRVKARTSPIAANRLLALISKIFSWALDEELVAASPAVRLSRPGQEVERERYLTAEEIRIVWAAFDGLGYPWGSLFKMLLITGQRCSEVAGMQWSEITGDGWRIPAERAKNGKGHLVPLSTLAREILEDAPEIGALVFRAHVDKALKGWSKATARMHALCSETIEPWRLHDLRRTFATQLRTLGVDRLVVSKLLNHAEAGVTKTYDRYSADPEKTAAMERWANRLREIISGTKSKKVIPYDRSRRRSKA